MDNAPAVPSTWDINELVRLLRQEKLFVSTEQQKLQTLNEKVSEEIDGLTRSAWISAHQRLNLNRLIVSRPDCTPATCCQKANALEATSFVDANKELFYQEVVSYAEFLRMLRLAPELVAQCLVTGERLTDSVRLSEVVQCLVTGLYGNLILPEDTLLVLQLLRQLAILQLTTSDNPRRLLRNGSCAFARLYTMFHEGLFSAKLFLTAALQGPIMQLLTDPEIYYDIDPNKAGVRLSMADRLKKFGREGTPEYECKLAEYRRWTIDNLVTITNRFIRSLQENIHCFPKSVCWLVKHIASMLGKSGLLEPKEVNAMCTDLIFTHFICLSIAHPELYGVCDAPISQTARFNLMQVGQILQMLSLMKYQEPDPKSLDLYNSFDRDAVPSIVGQLLHGSDSPDDGPISVNVSLIQGVKRNNALFTLQELHCLTSFFQCIYSSVTQEQAVAVDQISLTPGPVGLQFPVVLREQLGILVNALPTRLFNGTASPKRDREQALSGPLLEPAGRKSGLLGKDPGSVSEHASSLSASNSSNSLNGSELSANVLIIPLVLEDSPEHIGLLTEHKFLSAHNSDTLTDAIDNMHITDSSMQSLIVPEERQQQQQQQQPQCEDGQQQGSAAATVADLNLGSGQEKRTRFSHSHDEGSIGGNTSDNLEAISEAASNHSVASSLELENEDRNDDDDDDDDNNDNLSDMVSANVSGRGTPNISGRDTPSSQVTDGEERHMEVRQSAYHLPPPQSLIGKQIRSEIDDKFCKFEIKKLLEGDETISIISDTWSTDVLASDSEIIEAQQHDRIANVPLALPHLPPASMEQFLAEPAVIQQQQQQMLLDVSETASESAWSTDVLASDSERLTEVDTDDTASVARSDDTARSELDDISPALHQQQLHQQIVRPVCHQAYVPPAAGATLNCTFRPIRDDAPCSPTRTEDFHNVTGRGGRKSDYRRRTVEYIDKNSNNVVHNSTESMTPHSRSSLSNNSGAGAYECVERSSILRTSSQMSETHRKESTDSSNLNSTNNCSADSSTADDLIVVASAASVGSGTIAAAAVSPAFLLANHVGAHKFVPSKTKNETDMIRLSNASLNSMSSGGGGGGGSSSSSSSSGAGAGTGSLESRNRPISAEESKAEPVTETTLLDSTEPLQWACFKVDDVQPSSPIVSVTGVGVGRNQSAIKPNPSTGAIPKSISFDMTAEKGDKELDDEKKNGGGSRSFFGKLRMGFRNRRGKSFRGGIMDDTSGRFEGADTGAGSRFRRSIGVDTMAEATISAGRPAVPQIETSEDILAKYRRKPSSTSDTNTTDSGASSTKSKGVEAEDERLTIDPANVEASFAFQDAKKKLRSVLSTSDIQYMCLDATCIQTKCIPPGQNVNELIAFLQLQLAKARNLKDWPTSSRISETLRCVRLFDDSGCRKLCQALRDDYCKRSFYNQYLLRCRQTLLMTCSYLESAQAQIRSESDLCNACLAAVCVKLFLDRQERFVLSFCKEFEQLKLSDEKIVLLEAFLANLSSEMEKDGTWQGANEAQLEQARVAIETTIMTQVYTHALYPNGEADISRDDVLCKHIEKLAKVVSPNHKDLLIDKMLQYECPWLPAQEALAVMAAYKTPRDKARCVVRCATVIMDLLSSSYERNIPTADDFTPVLVYVIIQSNPQSLMSTVQYVNCFYGGRLCGEEQYWWTQFCAAVEFIKTMDYTD